jgi:hypothetical protein
VGKKKWGTEIKKNFEGIFPRGTGEGLKSEKKEEEVERN